VLSGVALYANVSVTYEATLSKGYTGAAWASYTAAHLGRALTSIVAPLCSVVYALAALLIPVALTAVALAWWWRGPSSTSSTPTVVLAPQATAPSPTADPEPRPKVRPGARMPGHPTRQRRAQMAHRRRRHHPKKSRIRGGAQSEDPPHHATSATWPEDWVELDGAQHPNWRAKAAACGGWACALMHAVLRGTHAPTNPWRHVPSWASAAQVAEALGEAEMRGRSIYRHDNIPRVARPPFIVHSGPADRDTGA
jgi:hypothetical protein